MGKTILAGALAALVFVAAASAAKPSAYTLTISPVDPGRGDTVSFTTDAPASVTPTAQVNCSQNGVPVLAVERGLYPGGWQYGQPVLLDSTLWVSGPADCRAALFVARKNGNRYLADEILWTASG